MRRIVIVLRRGLHGSRLAQLALIALFWLIGEGVSRLAHLPVPGGVVGLLLVLALLASGRLSLLSLQGGARWLLAEMLLFFIPAVPAVMEHREFLGMVGLKVLAVILVGTLVVMLATAFVVDIGCRLMRQR